MSEGDGLRLQAHEVETLKALIRDWGFEYSLKADREKVWALARRLDVHGYLGWKFDESDGDRPLTKTDGGFK